MTVEDDKEVARYENKLQIYRIVIEKILLGAVLAGIAYLGNIYIENYKSNLQTQRFLLESRLTALKELQSAHSVIAEKTLHVLAANSLQEDWDSKSYQEAVREFERTSNKWKFLFSSDFDMDVSRHVWFYQAIGYEKNVAPNKDDYTFVVGVFSHFDSLAKAALAEETLGRTPIAISGFQLPKWTYAQIEKTGGTQAFFEEAKKLWPQENTVKWGQAQL